jgi:hypothetical protein
MDSEIATYTVGVIGFERAERHVLRRMHGFRARPDDASGTWRTPGIHALVVDNSLPVRVQMRGAPGVDNYLMKSIQREMFNDLGAGIVRPAAAI